ncbi:MAG: serine hydrolase domain-containing protein [Mariniblastus sp.]
MNSTAAFEQTTAKSTNEAVKERSAAATTQVDSKTSDAGSAEKLSRTELEKKIQALVQPYIEGKVLKSVAIGVIDGDSEFILGLGEKSESDPVAPDGDTIFEIGSISKVFTGVLLADAIGQGIVTIDQNADELLPDGVAMPVWPPKPERKITLRHLSTHLSALPGMPDNLTITNEQNPYADYTSEQLFEFLNNHTLRRRPGGRDEYSNLAVGLLGQILSRKQDQTYENILLNRIVKPLGLNDTVITLSPDQKKRLAQPHDEMDETSTWELPALEGAGAIRSSIKDMLIFAKATLDPPDNEVGKAIELGWSTHREFNRFGKMEMGLGWMINPSGTHWHNGGTGGSHSIMFVSRKSNRALVVFSNTGSFEVDRLGSEIMAMLAGKDVKPRKFEKRFEVSESVCEKYIGKYQLTDTVFFDVKHPGKSKTALAVKISKQTFNRIVPESDTMWAYRDIPAKIEFEVDKSGQCKSLTLIQNGLRQKAKKIK